MELVRDRVKAAVEKAMDTVMTSTTVSQRVVDITHLVETQLRLKLNSIQSGHTVSLGPVPKLGNFNSTGYNSGKITKVLFYFSVEESRKSMKLVDAKMLHLAKKNFEFRTTNASVHLKLDELRQKILRAKQAASSVLTFEYY